MSDNYNVQSHKKRLRIIILTATLVLIAALIVCGVIAAIIKKNSPPTTKEQLMANVSEGIPKNAYNVMTALKKWDFPDFDGETLSKIEYFYQHLYYTEIESHETLAAKTAEIFIDEYYESIDLKDKSDVTNALASSYISAVGDRYGVYRDSEENEIYEQDLSGHTVGIGVIISKNHDGNILVKSLVRGAPAESAGIKASDVIVAVDGTRVSTIGYKEATDRIRGKIDTKLTVTILRGDKESDITVTRKKFEDVTVNYEMLGGSVGYISIERFKGNTAKQFVNAIDTLVRDGAVGIIFDLRSNPGGLLRSVSDILSYIVPTGTEIASFSNGKPPMKATHGTELEPTDNVYTLPSVVLVNSSTASAAELFAAAMRDFGEMELLDVTVVGKTTFGKGVMQTTVDFPAGASLTLTVARYNAPLGENYDGIGVIPSSTVKDGENAIEHSTQVLLDMIE